MKHSHIFDLTDSLSFGKYKGYALQTILLKQPRYIVWCLENIDGFQMSSRAWDFAVSRDAAFSSFRATAQNSNSTLVEMRLPDGTEILTHYPWKDKQAFRTRFMDYARTFAEDVVGVYQSNIQHTSMNHQLELQFVL